MKINFARIGFILIVCLSCIFSSAWAQAPSANVTTFATGLEFPRGLKFGPDGNLYVAEAGAGGTLSTVGVCEQAAGVGPYTGGFTSRISRITPSGLRTTVADNLPSSVDQFGDFGGIADVVFLGDTLYVLSGFAGCSHGLANNPNAVLRVNIDGTTTQVANLSAFLMANPAAHPNPDDFEPDGTWYSMVAAGDNFVALEPNHGELDMITTAGVVTRIVDISASQGHIVPTAVVYDGNFYVGNLQTFPPGAPAQILKITPAGAVSTFATGFTEVLGLAFDAAHRLYVLESSTGGDFPNPGTGKVVRLDGSEITEIATGLSLPTAMTFGPDGNLYVSNWGFGPTDMGEIVKIDVNETPVRLANVSSRGDVQSGDDVMIAGFILNRGSVSTDVVIRALGPSLAASGVHGTLSDPTLDVRNASGTRVAFNNDWQDDPTQAAKISAAGLSPQNPLDSAVAITLQPGAYTAIVAGNNGATGVGLVEVYSLK